jgi:hypothetical protein
LAPPVGLPPAPPITLPPAPEEIGDEDGLQAVNATPNMAIATKTAKLFLPGPIAAGAHGQAMDGAQSTSRPNIEPSPFIA